MLLKVTNTSGSRRAGDRVRDPQLQARHRAEPRLAGRRWRVDRVGRARDRDRDRPRRRRDGLRADRRRRRRRRARANAYTTVRRRHRLTSTPTCSGTDHKNAFSKDLGTIAPGAWAWWGVAVLFDGGGERADRATAWATFAGTQTPTAARRLPRRDGGDRATPPVAGLTDAETEIWRQAETVLRMGQIQEPYARRRASKNTGMILASCRPAAGTPAGSATRSTRSPRSRAPVTSTARRTASNFFLNADAGRYGSYVDNVPYRISTVRYYGDGQEEADYSGSPTPNIEIDGWGLFLWAARTYVDASATRGWLAETTKKGDTVYDAIKNGVAEPLARTSRRPAWPSPTPRSGRSTGATASTSCTRRAAAARGFCDMATIARRAGKTDDVARYKRSRGKAARLSLGRELRRLAARARRLAREARAGQRTTTTARRSRRSAGVARRRRRPDRDRDARRACAPADAGAAATSASRARHDQYDTNEWILIDLRASRGVPPRGRHRQGRRAARLGDRPGVGELQPAARALQHASRRAARSARTPARSRWSATARARTCMTLLDRAGSYEHTDCGDNGPRPVSRRRAGRSAATATARAATGGRTGRAPASRARANGGPGAPGNLVVFGSRACSSFCGGAAS